MSTILGPDGRPVGGLTYTYHHKDAGKILEEPCAKCGGPVDAVPEFYLELEDDDGPAMHRVCGRCAVGATLAGRMRGAR